MTRQIILDTETTGLSPAKGDRVIEIACLEMIDRRLTGEKFHTYLQPYRFVNPHAFKIHGLSDEFLADKPRFKDVGDGLYEFIKQSEIIIHNAEFDLGFLNHEFMLMGYGGRGGKDATFLDGFNIICTKKLAQRKFGFGGNRLDELCDKFEINREGRTLHGALIDCALLAEVYLKLTESEVCNLEES